MKNLISGKHGQILLVLIISLITVSAVGLFWKQNQLLNSKDKSQVLSMASVKSTTSSAELIDYIVITETPVPTPTPKPTLTPTPTIHYMTGGELETLFAEAGNGQSISSDLLRKIAHCESGFNPGAKNGIYGGLFQFSTSTWIVTRLAMNKDTNPALRFNPAEAIKTAAFKLATDGIHAWPNCVK